MLSEFQVDTYTGLAAGHSLEGPQLIAAYCHLLEGSWRLLSPF